MRPDSFGHRLLVALTMRGEPGTSRRGHPRGFVRPSVVSTLMMATSVVTIVTAVTYGVVASAREQPGFDDAGDSPAARASSPGQLSDTFPSAGPRPVPPAAGDPAPITRLADLRPVDGGERLADLPSELAGQAGYDGAVVLACPSNRADDQISEVRYEAEKEFARLEATLRAYRDPPGDSLTRLEISADPPSDPGAGQLGAAQPGEPHLEQLRDGEWRRLSINVDDGRSLRLRLSCDQPGGYAILAGASLHATDA